MTTHRLSQPLVGGFSASLPSPFAGEFWLQNSKSLVHIDAHQRQRVVYRSVEPLLGLQQSSEGFFTWTKKNTIRFSKEGKLLQIIPAGQKILGLAISGQDHCYLFEGGKLECYNLSSKTIQNHKIEIYSAAPLKMQIRGAFLAFIDGEIPRVFFRSDRYAKRH